MTAPTLEAVNACRKNKVDATRTWSWCISIWYLWLYPYTSSLGAKTYLKRRTGVHVFICAGWNWVGLCVFVGAAIGYVNYVAHARFSRFRSSNFEHGNSRYLEKLVSFSYNDINTTYQTRLCIDARNTTEGGQRTRSSWMESTGG